MKQYYLLLYFIFNFSKLIISQEPQQNFEENKIFQNNKLFKLIDIKYHHGKFIKNTSRLNNIMNNSYDALDIRFGIKGDGKKQKWDKLYGFPEYGLGFYSIFFKGPELGSPNAIYLFLRPPIFKHKRFEIDWELATGLSFRFKKYNPETNPEQQIIGSSVNIYVNLATGISYLIGNKYSLTLDFDATHFSNGSIKTPNIGVNIFGFAIGGRYNVSNKIRKNLKKLEIPKYIKHSEIIIYGGAGSKATTTQIFDGPNYFVSAISLDYAFCYHHIGKIGVGIDGFYESALQTYPEKIINPKFSDFIYSGIHISHYLRFYKLAFVTQLGYNLSAKVAHKKATYFILGSVFNINDKIFLRIDLKTRNGPVADFIVWGIGYNIPILNKNKAENLY